MVDLRALGGDPVGDSTTEQEEPYTEVEPEDTDPPDTSSVAGQEVDEDSAKAFTGADQPAPEDQQQAEQDRLVRDGTIEDGTVTPTDTGDEDERTVGSGASVPGTGGTVQIEDEGETVRHTPTGETRDVEDVAPTGETVGTGTSVPGTGGTVQVNDDGTVTHTPTGETRDPTTPTDVAEDAAEAAEDALPDVNVDVPGTGAIVGVLLLVGLLIAAALAVSGFARGAGRGVTS